MLLMPITRSTQHQKKNGFTLVEIMVVMVIIATLAALALPKLRMLVIDQDIERTRTNMRAIFAAQQTIYMNTGHFWPNEPDNACSSSFSQILQKFELGFPDNGWTYICSATPGGTTFACYADKTFTELNLTFHVKIISDSADVSCVSTGAGNGHHLCPKQAVFNGPVCN